VHHLNVESNLPRLSPPELPASSIPKELGDPAPLRFSLPGEWLDRHGRSLPKLDIRRIVVLKADHIGDLLIAGPAFGLLRRFFPFAQIDLICGPWNVTLARKLGIFDNVYGISLFHEVGGRQSDLEIARATRRDGVRVLQDLSLGPYDLALDLRHDIDSRMILPALDAQVYAGFGTSRECPFLDIVLPIENASTGQGHSFDLVLGGQSFHRGGAVNADNSVRGSGQIAAVKDAIELEMLVTGARSPAECGTVAEDTRELGIGLAGVSLRPLLDGQPLPGGWGPLLLKPPHRDVRLVSGWADPEDWGAWGIGALQRLRLALPPARGESHVQLDLDLVAHVHGGNPEVSCIIQSEGAEPGEPLRFLAPHNQQTLSILVPRHDSAAALASEPFRLGPGMYEGALRLYLPMPVTPDMALRLTLRDLDSGAALMTRSVGWGSLRSGLCDIPYACAIETGDAMLCLEVAAANAAVFEGTRIEMFTLHCVRRAKTNVPASHMEKRASMLVLRLAMEFSREPPFDDNLLAERLTTANSDATAQRAVDEIRSRLQAWKTEGSCLVGIAPGCSNPIRTWPRHYFVELARSLSQLGNVKLVFIGGPAEGEDAAELCRQLALDPALHSLCGAVGLADLGQVLEPLDLFIGNNTGTTHYAGRVGVRTIAIYSGTNPPREWGPVGDNVSWIYRDEDCAPCFLSDIDACRYGHVCLRNLLPADVLAIVAPEVLAVLSRRQLAPAK
jgi:ADP-heptose:LPS heptosyltransferase